MVLQFLSYLTGDADPSSTSAAASSSDDLDEEDLFDLDGEGDYEDPESYIEYDQALYYDGPDDYYDGIEQFNMEDMADYPGEVSPELLEKIFGENPASGDELDALYAANEEWLSQPQ